MFRNANLSSKLRGNRGFRDYLKNKVINNIVGKNGMQRTECAALRMALCHENVKGTKAQMKKCSFE